MIHLCPSTCLVTQQGSLAQIPILHRPSLYKEIWVYFLLSLVEKLPWKHQLEKGTRRCEHMKLNLWEIEASSFALWQLMCFDVGGAEIWGFSITVTLVLKQLNQRIYKCGYRTPLTSDQPICTHHITHLPSHAPGHHNCKHTGMQNCKQLLKWLLVPPMCITVKHCCFISSLGFLWHLQPSDITLSPIHWRGIWIRTMSHWHVGWKAVGFHDRTACRGDGCGWVNLVWKPRREMCFTNTVHSQWQNSCPPNIVRQQ